MGGDVSVEKKKYNNNNVVCIVDDGFLCPAVRAGKETEKVFFTHDLESWVGESWDDTAIQKLCINLLQKGWNIQAFHHPNFYEDKLAKDIYISDILVFDWEYKTGGVEQISILRRILSGYSVYVYIFSGADKEGEIRELIRDKLKEFSGRVSYLSKDDGNGYEKTALDFSNKLNEMKEKNFSFYFGSSIRRIVANSIESILVKFADMNLKNVLSLLSHDRLDDELSLDMKDIISLKIAEHVKTSSEIRNILFQGGIEKDVVEELIGMLEGKIKNSIISAKLPLPKSENSPHSEEKNTDIMGALWSFRLYYKPLDEDRIVRTGDIIVKKSSTDFSNLYLVITDDCSLSRFAKKTGGVLNTVELTRIIPGVDNKIKIKGLTSLTNIAGLSGTNGRPLLLPYIPVEDNQLRDYLLLMQRHFTIECKVKEGSSLIYDDIDYRRVCSISSPFLHTLIGTIISNLFGWGCPDYPSEIQEDIKKRCEVKSEEKQRNTEV